MSAELKSLLAAQQKISNGISETGSAVQTARVTPVNAVAAAVTILATEVAQMSNGDTITFDGVTLTKAAATDAEAGEFLNIAGIRSCVDELIPAWATSGTTNATLTRKVKGLAWNDINAVSSIVEATTAGGGAEAESTATIAAAMLAVMAAGDTVTFDENVFTLVASEAGAGEFTNATTLAALINGLDDWAAVENAGAVDITAAVVGDDWDGYEAVVTLSRATEGGINGTVGLKDMIVADASNLYVATANNTVNDANWKKVALSSL